jgi:hypothetical protein
MILIYKPNNRTICLIILLFLLEKNSKIYKTILMALNSKKIKNLKKYMANGNY